MRRIIIISAIILLFCLNTPGICGTNTGSGNVSISYLFLDEEGNQSVNHSTFNLYEGPGVSIEKFKYSFDNGIRVGANLKNIILNNRNLNLQLDKSGLFGIKLNHNQYRRFYDFDGTKFTRRRTIGGKAWIYPHRYIKLWGGLSNVGRAGNVAALFNTDPAGVISEVDYSQTNFNGGIQLNHDGRILRTEYRRSGYTDNKDSDRDQTRNLFRFVGLYPLDIPSFYPTILTGGFRRFCTKYNVSDYKISSNRGWGGFLIDLPEDFELHYDFIFDRTTSDSDFAATDNLTNAVYLSHQWPSYARLTVGYQHNINDDYSEEIGANSYYVSGAIKPLPRLEFRADYGMTKEDVKEGSRSFGDEERTRYRLSGKYRSEEYGAIGLRYGSRIRKNDDLGTRIDFNHFSADYSLAVPRYGFLSAGYTYSKGDYENLEEMFEFTDHTVFGDIKTIQYQNLDGGFGVTYYRSKRDLDVESFILRFEAGYDFYESYRFEVKYNVHNFDDFLVTDRYYTANIVEINIIKHISF
jgi:hypothetical protein